MKRRDFFTLTAAASAGALVKTSRMFPAPAAAGLSDPALQPKFVNLVPNALHPSFIFRPKKGTGYDVAIQQRKQWTGLVDALGKPVPTTVWGYGYDDGRGVSWPGRTFEVKRGERGGETRVRWQNMLYGEEHLLPVDTNLHWCYSLHGPSSANGVDYTQYSIANNGLPLITHLHGGHSDFQFDGNPEFFYTPGGALTGPQWDFAPGGFATEFVYDNDVPAGNLWYHDHALGITRLNVYAGLAGFFFIRDEYDTGKPSNPLGLPAYPYELAYAIQDRMFIDNGELFYPAYPGDPLYEDFITGEGASLPADLFPGGGPTALAEFFGDHMVVNGVIWPKENVKPRNYRMRLLNGCDSRFIVLQFRAVPADATDLTSAGAPIPFCVIGSDQGLASSAVQTDRLVFEPGSRYDIVFDFKGLQGHRVIMTNIGGDEPFGGDIPGPQVFGETDRIMAFDVDNSADKKDGFDPTAIAFGPADTVPNAPTRKVALFEGKDEFERLQPLLGVVNADNTATAYTWFQDTTENPDLDATEIWEIYNFTGDAHPIHLHLVNFKILGRNEISFNADENNPDQVLQHNGEYGTVAAVSNIVVGAAANLGVAEGYVENAPKDMVTALPEQVTRIQATFDKPGRYVWHCHILSHEDHEMMRVLQVGPGAQI